MILHGVDPELTEGSRNVSLDFAGDCVGKNEAKGKIRKLTIVIWLLLMSFNLIKYISVHLILSSF